ncbi:MAG: TIGR02996 domain-containing protein [Gemmataceae bacterium]
MNEEEFFLLDILARPDDEAPRLIYADWLGDRDDPRGELIREDWSLRGSRDVRGVRRDFELRRALLCRQRDWLVQDGLVLTRAQFILAFRLRLAEVIAYCTGRKSPGLRTWDLDPRTLTGFLATRSWPRSREIDWPGMVWQVGIARRRWLEQQGMAPSRPAASCASGRLLVFDPWLSQGTAEAWTSSGGYFDTDSLPPWDTWVAQILEPSPCPRPDSRRPTPHFLVAWVPPSFVQRAAWAIESNSDRSLLWLSEVNSPFVRDLREAGVRP